MKKLALAAVAITALTACGTTPDPKITQQGQKAASEAKSNSLHTVVYTVEGTTRKGSIDYNTPSGQEQVISTHLPWSTTFETKDGDAVFVSGQTAPGTGTITCTIIVDGKLVKRGKSNGAYAAVTCDALIGS